jgi:hypothetical protein
MEQFEICYTIPISDARCGGLVVLAGLVGEHTYLAHKVFKGVLNSVGSVNEEVRVTSGILLSPVNDDLNALQPMRDSHPYLPVECMRAV